MFFFSVVFMVPPPPFPRVPWLKNGASGVSDLFGVRVNAALPDLWKLVWGAGWLAGLGMTFGLGHGHVDFAGSTVVHMTGGVIALAGTLVLGRAQTVSSGRHESRRFPSQSTDGHRWHTGAGVRLVRVQRRIHPVASDPQIAGMRSTPCCHPARDSVLA